MWFPVYDTGLPGVVRGEATLVLRVQVQAMQAMQALLQLMCDAGPRCGQCNSSKNRAVAQVRGSHSGSECYCYCGIP